LIKTKSSGKCKRKEFLGRPPTVLFLTHLTVFKPVLSGNNPIFPFYFEWCWSRTQRWARDL